MKRFNLTFAVAVLLLAYACSAEAGIFRSRRASSCQPGQACYQQPQATYYSTGQGQSYAPVQNPAQPQTQYTYPVYYQTTTPAPQPLSGDVYGFTNWLNGVRAQYGLGAVGCDANLCAWAATNNNHQNAYGMGHHVMGPARRQNSGRGASTTVFQMWMESPAHRAALLDPSITWIGIAAGGAYWTFNAY